MIPALDGRQKGAVHHFIAPKPNPSHSTWIRIRGQRQESRSPASTWPDATCVTLRCGRRRRHAPEVHEPSRYSITPPPSVPGKAGTVMNKPNSPPPLPDSVDPVACSICLAVEEDGNGSKYPAPTLHLMQSHSRLGIVIVTEHVLSPPASRACGCRGRGLALPTLRLIADKITSFLSAKAAPHTIRTIK